MLGSEGIQSEGGASQNTSTLNKRKKSRGTSKTGATKEPTLTKRKLSKSKNSGLKNSQGKASSRSGGKLGGANGWDSMAGGLGLGDSRISSESADTQQRSFGMSSSHRKIMERRRNIDATRAVSSGSRRGHSKEFG